MKAKQFWLSWLEARRLKRLSLAHLPRPGCGSLPLLVSLTSIPSRLNALPLTIRSLLNQTHPPKKILLWLHHSLASQLPDALIELVSDVFEIRYVDLTCPHRKLIHTRSEFPTEVVVTCDDDMMYPPHWLAHLYHHHQQNPNAIIANECRQISRDADGQLLPYPRWPRLKLGDPNEKPLLPIGYAGVLYPPDALDARMVETELFMKLAPNADDLWFRAMAYLKNTPVVQTAYPFPSPLPIIGSQTISLLNTNVKEDRNRQQWAALVEFFGIDL